MSRGVFPSVSRTPLFPGGVYEGEKKERGDTEKSDYNRNVGKVVDTLTRDYPRMFDEPLDFDIYTPELQMRDPVRVRWLVVCVLFCKGKEEGVGVAALVQSNKVLPKSFPRTRLSLVRVLSCTLRSRR